MDAVQLETEKPDDFVRWRGLIAVNVIVIFGHLAYKLHDNLPGLAYAHLLVDYHFGFIKRGLVGAAMSLAFDRVPQWPGKVLAAAAVLVTFALYLRLFQKTFGFRREHAPTFVYIVGSPFFFKNFIHTFGYFDIFGCAVAILLLLVRASSGWYVFSATLSCVLLIVIHQLHAILYVPTIVGIVVVRHFLLQGGVTRSRVAGGLAALAVIVAACAYIQFFTGVRVSAAEFTEYMRARMAPDGTSTSLAFGYVWFMSLADQFHETWDAMGEHWKLWYIGYPIAFAIHWPLIQYMTRSMRNVSSAGSRRAVLFFMILVTLAYLILFAIAFDYARYIANWVVCMILLFHAALQLPASPEAKPIPLDDRGALWLAIPLSLLPRVGILRPFNL